MGQSGQKPSMWPKVPKMHQKRPEVGKEWPKAAKWLLVAFRPLLLVLDHFWPLLDFFPHFCSLLATLDDFYETFIGCFRCHFRLLLATSGRPLWSTWSILGRQKPWSAVVDGRKMTKKLCPSPSVAEEAPMGQNITRQAIAGG